MFDMLHTSYLQAYAIPHSVTLVCMHSVSHLSHADILLAIHLSLQLMAVFFFLLLL